MSHSLNDVPIALETEVLVVGGGPAGAAAGYVLASAGHQVTIIDKAVFPRDKCCGDGLTTLALRELELLNFTPDQVPSWRQVESAWLRSPSGREVEVPLVGRGQYAAVTPRFELDNALLDHARQAGAKVLDGHGFAGIVAQTSDSIVVEVAGVGSVQARYLIAADGMWSPVRKALGLAQSGYLGEWHGFRQYASDVTGPAKDRMYVWFDSDILPGYAWSFPLPDGRVNVGFGVLRDGKRKIQDMKDVWPDLLARPHIREALGDTVVMEDRHTAWPIPARVTDAALAHNRVLFVGDAATATDPMTGEGIGQALLTGRVAAQAIIAGGAVGATYKKAVKHHLFADHRMSVLLGKALRHPRGARGAVRVVGLNDWTRRNFARWMFEDEPRAVVLTPSRWHRRFLTRDGAFVRNI